MHLDIGLALVFAILQDAMISQLARVSGQAQQIRLGAVVVGAAGTGTPSDRGSAWTLIADRRRHAVRNHETPTTKMDLISQIQSFVRTLSSSLAHTVEYFLQPPPLPADYDQFDDTPVQDRAANLFKLFAQTDTLMASLPARFSSEQEQLEIIAQLSKKNDECGEELARAQQELELWRTRLADTLEDVAKQQFATYSTA